jgi:glycosyltransferase involved in cell wall biosynthesis
LKIAYCAPVDIHMLARFSGVSTEGVERGLGGTASTPVIIELLRRGHDVTVYTLSTGEFSEKIYEWGRLRIFVGSRRPHHLARNFFRQEIAYLKRVIQAEAPPFVHANWTYEFSLGALRSGVLTVTTIHDLAWKVLACFRDPYRAIRLLMAYEVAFRGKYFTAVSEDAALHFRRYFKPGAQIQVIPNGLPSAAFELGKQSVEKNGVGITFATILQGWSRRKNATGALKAFGIVQRKVPGARLLMFGMGYEKGGAAQQWASRRNLDTGVSFVGVLPYADLLKRVHQEVDIIVHPSLDEAFSMTGLESLALKKVFIAGEATPGMREMLASGDAGVLVDIRDPAALAEAMAHLSRDAGYRNRVAQRGFERASSHYTIEAVVDQYEALYRNMLRS